MTDTPSTLATSRNDDPLDLIIAEDDPHDQMLLVMAAQESRLDIEFSFVADGEELLALLRSRHAEGRRPDVLVLDMRMPRLDGHEVLDTLAEHPGLRPLQVGIFSSSHRQKDIDRSLEKGAAWHEVKPTRFEELVDFVERIAEAGRTERLAT